MSAEEPLSRSEVEGLDDLRMGFLEHLGELRRRVIYSLIAVFAAFLVAWAFKFEIFEFLKAPLVLAASNPEMATLHQQDMVEVFFTLLKASLLVAFFAASPVVFYHIWKFIAPGLYPNEKRAALPFIVLGSFFFFLGASFCYYLVIPLGYEFLFDFSEQAAEPVLMIERYFALTTKLLLAFGVVFELPVVTMFLSAVGLITHRELIKQWRIAVVVAFVIAAMLTPPDVITQVMLAGPMLVLYLLSIGIAYVLTRRREKREAAKLEKIS